MAQGDPLNALKSNADAPKPKAQPTTVASLERPRMADIGRASRLSPATLNAPGRIEDKVFGAKRYYSMTLNMPNLTSAGGSWIIRFAELNETTGKGEVVAPQAGNNTALHQVDGGRDDDGNAAGCFFQRLCRSGSRKLR